MYAASHLPNGRYVVLGRFEMDAGSMVKAACTIVGRLGIKGIAKWRQRLPANGPDFFGVAWHLDCDIQVDTMAPAHLGQWGSFWPDRAFFAIV